MPHTVNKMGQIMVNSALELDGKVDYFFVQRIAPSGRAEKKSPKWFIEKYQVNEVMQTFKKIKDEYGFNVEFCDVFPWCSVKPEYRDMLPKGGCNWGTEVLAVFQDGDIKRCAMENDSLSKNMLDLDTKEKFMEFWNTDPELVAFRKQKHLDEKCLECEMLEDCGGSCVMSREGGDPYKGNPSNPQKGHDYLADQNCEDCRKNCGRYPGED
jgi:radical SAM protein with 4Fe4S-binding SPASM domain